LASKIKFDILRTENQGSVSQEDLLTAPLKMRLEEERTDTLRMKKSMDQQQNKH